jgi:hypothetical protein
MSLIKITKKILKKCKILNMKNVKYIQEDEECKLEGILDTRFSIDCVFVRI